MAWLQRDPLKSRFLPTQPTLLTAVHIFSTCLTTPVVAEDKNTAIRIWTPVEVERGNRTKQCNDCLGKVLLCTKGIFLKTKPSAGNRQKVHQKYSLRDRHLNRLFPLGRIQLILYGIHRCTCIVHSQ